MSAAVVGGVGVRGAGQVGACCGTTLRSSLERQTPPWLGASLSRDVGARLAVDVEVTWDRAPRYSAYVQGSFGNAPYRGYASENLVTTILPAGLLRWHAWRGEAAALDVVGGAGWSHQRRASDLRSIVFKPGLEPPSEYTFHVGDVHNSAASIAGVDLIAGSGRVSFVGQGRLHLLWRGDENRTDLDLGRRILRAGAGLRFRF